MKQTKRKKETIILDKQVRIQNEMVTGENINLSWNVSRQIPMNENRLGMARSLGKELD